MGDEFQERLGLLETMDGARMDARFLGFVAPLLATAYNGNWYAADNGGRHDCKTCIDTADRRQGDTA